MATFQEEYENLLIFQYFDKPKFKAELSGIISKFNEVFELQKSLELAFDLDTAVGKQLDIIGNIVGIRRKTENIVLKKYFGFYDEQDESGTFGEAPFFTFDQQAYTALELNDFDYRTFIKAKITINMLKNNFDYIQTAISFLFNRNAYVVDNKDTTFTLYINRNVDIRLVRYINILGLLPRPQTISYNYIARDNDSETFGFFDINPNAVGFGQGAFTQFINF